MTERKLKRNGGACEPTCLEGFAGQSHPGPGLSGDGPVCGFAHKPHAPGPADGTPREQRATSNPSLIAILQSSS